MAVTDPKPMSRAAVVANAICLPLGLIALVFLPVGRLDWKPGWIFIAFLVAAFGASALSRAGQSKRLSSPQPLSAWNETLGPSPGHLDPARHDHRGPAGDLRRWSDGMVVNAEDIGHTRLRPTWHWNRAQHLGSGSQPLLRAWRPSPTRARPASHQQRALCHRSPPRLCQRAHDFRRPGAVARFLVGANSRSLGELNSDRAHKVGR